MLAERLGPTLLLGSLTLLFNFTLGLAPRSLEPHCIRSSVRARLVGALTIVGYATPSFVIGMLLIWGFGVELAWLPPADLVNPFLPPDAGMAAMLADRLSHLVLPLSTMVLATVAVPLRQQRAASLAIVAQPWVRAARARGVSPAWIAWRHSGARHSRRSSPCSDSGSRCWSRAQSSSRDSSTGLASAR